MTTFAELAEAFKAYATAYGEATDVPVRPCDDLAREVVIRLQQLAVAVDSMQSLDEQYHALVVASTGPGAESDEQYAMAERRDRQIQFQRRYLAESFYYFAFRLRRIVRSRECAFPGFAGFEAAGVRDVRNHLIEHPESEASRVLDQTWLWSRETGLSLQTGRQDWEPADFADPGFYANAEQFRAAFEKCLRRGQEELGLASA